MREVIDKSGRSIGVVEHARPRIERRFAGDDAGVVLTVLAEHLEQMTSDGCLPN